MGNAKVLLISLPDEPVWTGRIEQILGGLPEPRFTLVERSVGSSNLQVILSAVREALARESLADVVLLLLSRLDWASEMVQEVVQRCPATPLLLVVEDASPEQLTGLIEAGVNDFIIPPIESRDLIPRLLRCLPSSTHRDLEFRKVKECLGLKKLVGESHAFKREVSKLPIISGSDSAILVTGETGTGKELIARAIHYLSHRSSKPFVPVSCGAIPPDLLENELFGHERGAYTGAFSQQRGLIELADGGTLFLDDVDCLPQQVQPNLLRFLELKEYRALGSASYRTGNVRIVAATNRKLHQLVREGEFRTDLFYRLDVVSIDLPPLRERMEDILLLARHFMGKFSRDFQKSANSFTPAAREKLLLHDWPGNVRELEHVMERSVLLCEKPLLDAGDLRMRTSRTRGRPGSFNQEKRRLIERFERSYIEKCLLANRGNISKAAHGAGKDRRTFWGLIRKHGIEVQRFKGRDRVKKGG